MDIENHYLVMRNNTLKYIEMKGTLLKLPVFQKKCILLAAYRNEYH